MAQRSPSRKPRSSGASRRGGAKKSGGGAPVWVWLATGLLTGLFIAFLVFLSRVDDTSGSREHQQAKSSAESAKEQKPPKPKEGSSAKKDARAETEKAAPQKSEEKEPVKSASADKPQNIKPTDPAPEKPALNYDFYKMLPKSEVVVPEEDLRKPSSAASTPGTYYLQVGAFRRIEEADSRKAELAMLGIVSAIQTVTVEPGSSWHRVRVGPVKDTRQLDKAKRQLQDNDISFVTLKENR